MNIMSSGFLVLFYGFEEKTVVITIKEKNIVDILIKYIKELKKYGFIAANSETIDFVQKELERRKDL